MTNFISKHPIKIQLSVAAGIIFAVMRLTTSATNVIDQVGDNAEDVFDLQEVTENIPVIESNILDIKLDIADIKKLLQK